MSTTMRPLLNPAAPEGGGGNPAPPANPANPGAPAPGNPAPTPNPGGPAPGDPAPQPTPTPAPQPAGAETLTVGSEYLQSLLAAREQLAQIERDRAAEAARVAAERDQMLAETAQNRQALEQSLGERDRALAAVTEERDRLRQGIQRERLNGTIADAMAGVTFASDAAREQARQLLASRVVVAERDGDFVVTSPTGTPAAEHLRGLLASADFAHFLAPQSRGGSGAADALPSPGPAPDAGGSVSERLLAEQLRRQGGPRRHPMFGPSAN